jgi:hypothetical protein
MILYRRGVGSVEVVNPSGGGISERLGVSLSILQFAKAGGYQLEEDDEPWDSYDQFVRGVGAR